LLSAQLDLARNRFDEGISHLNLIPDQSELAPRARFQAGQVELRRNRLKQAETYYLKAMSLDPKAVRPRRELVYIYGMQSRFRELAKQFPELGRLVSLTPDDVILWCLSRSLSWRPEEITEDLRRFVEADPTDRWSRLALAENLFRRQYLDEASQVIEPLPLEDPDVRAFLARLAMERGEIDRAEALVKEGPEAHAGLARLSGKLFLHRHNGKEALRQFRLSYAADPDHRETLNGMAQSLLLLGRPEDAKPFQKLTKDYDALGVLIEKLASKGTLREPSFYRQLGAAYEAVGRLDEAKAWFQLVIITNPLDIESQKALFRISQAQASKNET
jgi:tetratricopeptide (TPR) repeat protein